VAPEFGPVRRLPESIHAAVIGRRDAGVEAPD
jgi:hypothetical protein